MFFERLFTLHKFAYFFDAQTFLCKCYYKIQCMISPTIAPTASNLIYTFQAYYYNYHQTFIQDTVII
jgi:hypothetical protein